MRPVAAPTEENEFMKLTASLVLRAAAAAALFSAGPAVFSGCAGGESDAPIEATSSVVQAVAAAPDSVVLNAVRDTSVRLSAPNVNAGRETSLDINRTLVAFDQAALAAAVGPTDSLVSARLELTLTSNSLRRLAPSKAVDAHLLKKTWTETGATWFCAVDADPSNKKPDCSGATAWSMGPLPPNPYVAQASASATISPAQTGVIGFDVTGDVRAMASGQLANDGWMLRSGGVGEFAEFASRESATPPRLVLTVRRCSAQLCDDGNTCTTDSCDAVAACVHTNAVDGASCSDGNACTAVDVCRAGACQPGPVDVCAPPPIVINEVESNGGVPGDWVELYNVGTTAVDLSNWVFKDNDDSHNYKLPAGTSIAAGGYLVLDEGAFGFGLGAADSARIYDGGGARLIDSHSWSAHAAVTYGRCPNGTGAFAANGTSTKGAANDCSSPGSGGSGGGTGGSGGGGTGGSGGPPATVVVNEVESSGGTPGDWIELYNAGASAVDLSGWIVRDNDDTHTSTIPANTVVAPGAYYIVEETALGFGLGSPDAARLFNPGGTLVDSYNWTPHATTTYGRCPNGSGAFSTTGAPTKGAANDCSPPGTGGSGGAGTGGTGGAGGIAFSPWSGGNEVTAVDLPTAFTSNLSGLTYQPAISAAPAVLWALQNGPSLLHRMEWNGASWVDSAADGWSAGKTLVYPSGTGGPDSEGVTKVEWDSPAIYVATERDNTANTVSRLSVLRYDSSAAGTTLTATHEWNLTADLPAVGANLGLEAITWVPDSYLVANGFLDESRNQPFDPALYPGHGTGIFFVGVEATGNVYAYALDHVGGGFTRLATFSSGLAGVMGMEFDRDVGRLWTTCDNTCNNRSTLFSVETAAASPSRGKFSLRGGFEPPSGIPASMNNEGVAIAPESECVAGRKPFFWSDDSDTGGNSLRQGTVACGPLF
jgi:hypothetical protein